MSVIIRLQNLPWSANALDIRQYFQGLSIPEGGVHIVGGELGDAFIAFSTDEDARQAMLTDGGKLKEVKIKLFLSSRSEMQKVIETARAQSLNLQTFMQIPSTQITATPIPPTQIPPTPPQTAPALPPMLPVSQMPVKSSSASENKQPPLPPLPPSDPPASAAPEIKAEPEPEKKDQDTESVSSRDAKRIRKGRSRSKSRNRSKSKDRSKSRERSKSRDRSRSRDRSYRSKDRYRDRRRRDRSRSRDRRDRRRYRDRSRSRDRSSRKLSRDTKRDSDRNDRNSTEKSSGAKVVEVPVPEKDKEIPLPTTEIPVPTSKPGFSSSGWVSAGSADKPGNSVLPTPIGFSIGKPLPSAHPPPPAHPQPPPPQPANRPNLTVPQQIPLPQLMQIPPQMPVRQQTPTTQQPVSLPMQIPQPPPFPQLPMTLSNEKNVSFSALPFTNNSQQLPTQQTPTTQHNVLFGPSQAQFLPPKTISQTESGLLPSVMWPQMGNIHTVMGPMQQPPPINVATVDKPPTITPMNMGMGMYIRPPVMPPNDKFQPSYSQQDPRMLGGFNPQQTRNDYRPEMPFSSQMNSFSPQKQANLVGPDYDSNTNSRDMFSNECIEIRNMSMSTTISDIRRFFHGLQIPGDGVKIITDKKGNKVGMAYVRFAKPFFKDMALKKSGQLLKNSAVEILHIDNSIFNKASDYSEFSSNYFEDSQGYHDNFSDNFNTKNITNDPFTDLVIHEVPSYAKDRDIYNLFRGFKISDAFVLLRTGRKTATGYVRFRTPADARKALTSSTKLVIDYTNVKATICYEHEFADARDRKNMEENDEEMMDSKDVGYVPNESRGSKKYPSYDFVQEKSDSRFNQHEKRGQLSKGGLLPTPNLNPFDPRSSKSSNNSNNYQSRFDRRQDFLPRPSKEDMHKKPYDREEFHQKPSSWESSRFQPKSMSRDDLNKTHQDFYKKSHDELYSRPHDQEAINQSQPPQYPINTPQSTVLSKQQSVSKIIVQEEHIEKQLTQSDTRRENKTGSQVDVSTSKPEMNKLVETTKNDNLLLAKANQNTEINVVEKSETPESAVKPKDETLHQLKQEDVDSVEEADVQEGQPQKNDLEAQRTMDFIDTDCIILRGLPFTATDRDILDFFSDEGLSPTQIHIMLDRQEKPAGDAFCEFNTAEEVVRALTKNQTLMGRSVVSVEPVSREEMMETLGAIIPPSDHSPRDYSRNYPYPERSRQDYRFPRMPSSGYPPYHMPRGRGRGSFRGRHQPLPEKELESQNVSAFGKPGCVVALENVPFRAEVQDIIDFFRGFFLPRDNVIRRFDEAGKPTGDARVCLSSPLEAHRAIKTLNYRQIQNRQIHLTLVP